MALAGGFELFSAAVRGPDLEKCRALRQTHGDRLDVNWKDSSGVTPLHVAARLDHPAVASFLVDTCGAALDVQDDRYDELRGMGKLCELMVDSLIKRFDEFLPNEYA